jgi:hypothetical protein
MKWDCRMDKLLFKDHLLVPYRDPLFEWIISAVKASRTPACGRVELVEEKVSAKNSL